jgi:hypothetical protein
MPTDTDIISTPYLTDLDFSSVTEMYYVYNRDGGAEILTCKILATNGYWVGFFNNGGVYQTIGLLNYSETIGKDNREQL